MSGERVWLLLLSCCGRDDGTYLATSWDEADQFRHAYTSGPGVDERGYSASPVSSSGHRRAAVLHRLPSVEEAQPNG